MNKTHTLARSNQVDLVPRYAWTILVIVFLTGLVAPMAKMKVPPVMPILIQQFSLTYTQAGWLMSFFSISGVLLAFPAGLIMQKFGTKRTGIIAVLSLLVGAVIGAISNNATLLLASRFIEGAGYGLFTVVGPSALAVWFPAKRRGLVMGIWSTFAPVGYLLVLNLVPIIGTSFPWQTVWWAGAILAALFLILFGSLFRLPKGGEVQEDQVQGDRLETIKVSTREALHSRDLWLYGFAFFCFSFVQMGFTTFYPTYLNQVLGFSLASASFLVSIQMIVLTAPIIGWISDRIGSRKKVMIVGLCAMVVMMLVPFSIVGYWAILLYMIVRGIFEDSTPTMCYAAAPELIAKPQYMGIAMAMLGIGQNLGNVFGPPIFGWIVEVTKNWALAGYAMIPVVLLGIVAMAFTKVR